MTKGDQLVDQAADRLQEFANRAAAEGGVKAKVAETLADDAAFLRKLKPSLVKARFRGEAPTNQQPAHGVVAPSPASPKRERGPAGVNPLVVVGAAFVVGVVVAKLIDWRGHAHPRD